MDHDVVELGAGDTVVIPERVPRQVTAGTDAAMLVSGLGDAVVYVPVEATTRRTPPWIG